MKKFNPEEELNKVQNKNVNNSKMSNMYIPLLVIACSCMALLGITFSTKLAEESQKTYKIRVDIINGDVDTYYKNVKEGAFSDTITSANTFGSIDCVSGNLNYDSVTGIISAPNVKEDISCVLAFMDDAMKSIDIENLNIINDNSGVSYYYKADATNNYLKINDTLFRIVRVNGDDTYRIITNDVVLTTTYGTTNDYNKSNVKVMLENWLDNTFANDEHVVSNDFDVINYTDPVTEHLINFDGYSIGKVGTLSVREAMLITKDVDKNNFLSNYAGIYLMNPNGSDEVYAYKNGQITSVLPTENLGVKAVINVKGELIGEGTSSNPYTFK